MVGVRSQPTLGDYLVREGIISQTQLNQALEEQLSNARSIGRILVDKGFITESVRMAILQKRFGFELVHLKEQPIEPILFLLIPYSFAEKHRVVPIHQAPDKTLVVAMEDPSDIMVLDAMKNQLGRHLRPVVASQEDIQFVLDQYTRQKETKAQQIRQAEKKRSLAFKILRVVFLPLMMLLPLAFFSLALAFDLFDIGFTIRNLQKNGSLNTLDLTLYFALTWGIWSVVMYEINGLMFHRKKAGTDEGSDEEPEA